MIHIPVNLASHPFRRTRAALVGGIVAGIALAVLLMIQATYIMGQRNQAADTRNAIDNLNAQLNVIAREQSGINATLRRPENAAALEESVFLNELIQRKAISWTKLFSDLEKVTPLDVRLISVRLPTIDAQNRVMLDMVVGADQPGPILEFLKHLESSPVFGSTSVMNSMPPGQNEHLYRYRVTVSYAQQL